MKLNATEIGLLSRIDAYQDGRKRRAWSTLLSLLIFIGAYWYLNALSEFLAGILLTLIVVALMHGLRVQFEIAPEDRLIEILRRYVNRDAEFIEQLSAEDRTTNDGSAAK